MKFSCSCCDSYWNLGEEGVAAESFLSPLLCHGMGIQLSCSVCKVNTGISLWPCKHPVSCYFSIFPLSTDTHHGSNAFTAYCIYCMHVYCLVCICSQISFNIWLDMDLNLPLLVIPFYYLTKFEEL